MKCVFSILLCFFLIVTLGACSKSDKNLKILSENNVQILNTEWSSSETNWNNAKVTFSVNSAEKFVPIRCYLNTIRNTDSTVFYGEHNQAGTLIDEPGTYVIYGSTIKPDNYYGSELCCALNNGEAQATSWCKYAGKLNNLIKISNEEENLNAESNNVEDVATSVCNLNLNLRLVSINNNMLICNNISDSTIVFTIENSDSTVIEQLSVSAIDENGKIDKYNIPNSELLAGQAKKIRFNYEGLTTITQIKIVPIVNNVPCNNIAIIEQEILSCKQGVNV